MLTFVGRAMQISAVLWLVLTLPMHSAQAAPQFAAASDWTTVSIGDRDGYAGSNMVSMIQYLLRAHGYSIAVDGEFGLKTQRQVRAFQHRCNLRVTGKVNGPTWAKLIVNLQHGSQGDAVRAAQIPLQQLEPEEMPIDGRFGLQTERAVRNLQKANGMRADGKIGPTTWLLLTIPTPD